MSGYKFKEVEEEVLEFWQKHKVYEKIKKRNKDKEKWTYLDGPPYTSGKIHLGTAWGKSLRDSIMRFKRMRGFDVFDRAGFDMHGLPTENKVAAKFNFTSKEQIEEFGVEKFQKECEKFCLENMELMIKDFIRIGVWMDFENPYMPIKKEFMEGEWFLAKKAFDTGRLYEGAKVMTWCASCETSVSKHELEYKEMNDNSIYVKFKLLDEEDTFLIIWTTTPWTIPFNLAVMVHPDFDYVKLDVEGEKWIVVKELAESFMTTVVEKEYNIIEEFKGKILDGKKYEHVFYNESDIYERLKKKHENVFRVIMTDTFVELTAGTGLVHCAPGCGPEDYEAGKAYNLPPFNETNESGVFSEVMKKFSGFTAKKDDYLFIEHMHNNGSLVAKKKIAHDYPTCWRCHKPVIFRPTEQWFFKVEDLKEKMIDLNNHIGWVPDAAYRAFNSWLENLKDNGVTRQRFWGTPVPIWKCSGENCEHSIVIGSIAELKEKAGKVPDNLHKPWIDEVTMPCEKCGRLMHRIPDIFDVWIDAGSAGWNAYDYPQNKEDFERYFPADLILEGKDQIRGWFNLLMVASTLAFDKPSFKNVYMHGFINDYRGIKMSKSIGNITSPQEIIDVHGADCLRYYIIGAANAGCDMNYNPEDPSARMKNILILWNLHRYLIDTIEVTGIDPTKVDLDKMNEHIGPEERYILSRLNSTIKDMTEAFDKYHLNETPDIFESFYLDLSRNYIQLIREKLTLGSDEDKQVIVKVLSECIEKTIRIAAPVIPFITEKMYQSIKKYIGQENIISIHECSWPQYDDSFINKQLEEDFDFASVIIQAILRAREKTQLGVRWPVREVLIESTDSRSKNAVEHMGLLIKNLVNAKEIRIVNKFDKVTVAYKPDYKLIGQMCGKDTPQVILKIGETSPETLASNLEAHGSHKIVIEGMQYEIKPEHLVKTFKAEEGWHAEDFKKGMVFLNIELDKELEQEGYAREIIRRIQNARKEAGLKKSEGVRFFIVTKDKDLEHALNEWKSIVAEKVGATKLEILHSRPDETFQQSFMEKIKGKELVILFNI
jgi:isoleucyl-tRNA synthetase